MGDINISCLSLQNLVVQLHLGGPSVPPGLSALVAPLDLVLLSEGGKTQPMFFLFSSCPEVLTEQWKWSYHYLHFPLFPLVPPVLGDPSAQEDLKTRRGGGEDEDEFITSVGRKKLQHICSQSYLAGQESRYHLQRSMHSCWLQFIQFDSTELETDIHSVAKKTPRTS